ncbi:unnamed protein product [Durusdinium trenchii]|uniref:Ankyrin repeat protein n=2 Tax=Durusdinium trenchii TaxID=1381693 RepID=A0ABP0Q2H4_9DINO
MAAFAALLLLCAHAQLQDAVRRNDAATVRQWLESQGVEDEGGYSYDASDGWGRSPLHEAVELGHLKVVEAILSWNGSAQLVSAPDELGWTPLHWAALKGSREIAKSLIEAKASVNARENEFHCEPLQWAARRGHVELLRLLLSAGANASYQDLENRTAADWAQLTGQQLAFGFLLGIHPTSLDETQEEAYNMSRLHAAVAKNNLTEIRRLLESNESEKLLEDLDAWGRTPLIASLQFPCRHGSAAAELLLEVISNNSETTPWSTKTGMTRRSLGPDQDGRDPLHWAALAGYHELVQICLKLIENREPDRWGRHLIHHAAVNGHVEVLDLLLDTKVAEVDSSAVFSQETALHLAAKAGHQDVVTKLLLRGAPLDAEDRLLRQPLHYAILLGHTEISNALLKAGADGMEKDMDGFSPLSFASAALGSGDHNHDYHDFPTRS